MLRVLLLICLVVMSSPARADIGEMLEDWMSWISYHFKWSAHTEWFQRKRCSMRQQTFFFGGHRQAKWTFGRVIEALDVKKKIKDHFQSVDLQFDEHGHLVNAGEWRRNREKYLQLMIGSDYFEPCNYGEAFPKLIEYKFSFPKDVLLSYGAFDFFIGKGVNCGKGRFEDILAADPPPPKSEGTAAFKTWQRKFQSKLNKRWSELDDHYNFELDILDKKNPPLVSFSPGEVPFFSGQHVGRTEGHNRIITSALSDWSKPEQKLCGVFHCYNPWLPCAVNIEQWYIGDVAGRVYESGQGDNMWGMTPMDKFTLFMMLFVPIFFCIQCCCFCQICSHELSGGVIDEQAVLEDRVMKERERRNHEKSKRGRGRERSPRRSPQQRSPRRKRRRSPRRQRD